MICIQYRYIQEQLKSYGVDKIIPNIGKTGVVGLIYGKKQGGNKHDYCIGIRADMDACML